MNAADLDALRSRAKDEGWGLREDAGLRFAGVGIDCVVEPPDGDALGEAIRVCGEARVPVAPVGRGTRLSLGEPPVDTSVALSTTALDGVDVFEPDEGVVHALAGTRLATIREQVGEYGWELPIDGPGARSLGGAIACAESGPRALGFYPVRRVVLGLEVIGADGVRTRCGGRVVKNVTGYDLAKLHCGALGTLGIVEGAWLRLLPKPERVEVRRLEVVEAPPLHRACWRPTLRALVDVWPGGSAEAPARGRHALIELAGDASAIERDLEQLEREHGKTAPAPASAIDDADAELHAEAPMRTRLRIDAPADRTESIARALAGRALRTLAQPGLGMLHVWLPEAPDTAAVIEELRKSTWLRRMHGRVFVESIPDALRGRVPAFAPDLPGLALMRTLKARFDPDHLLNRGRHAGGLEA